MHSIRNLQEPSQKSVSVAPNPDAPSLTRPCELSSLSSSSATERIRNFTEPVPVSMAWTVKALRIPEIVFLIQEQLPRHWLLVSLQVSRQWYRTGQALVWRKVHWDNTMATEQGGPLPAGVLGTTLSRESLLFENAYRIRSLDCMFHSQGRTSNVDSSSLLRLMISGKDANLSSRPSEQASLVYATEDGFLSQTKTDLWPRNPREIQRQNNFGLYPSFPDKDRGLDDTKPVRAIQLCQLMLKGHFDLLSSTASLDASTATTDNRQRTDRVQPPTFVAFKIPTLTRLEIHPLINSAVDIHLILDSALRLEELVIHSHGHFIDSRLSMDVDDPTAPSTMAHNSSSQQIHGKLRSLKIQYLKISREELQQIANRCPNVTEFQSLCTPGALWKQRPVPLQQQTAPAGPAVNTTSQVVTTTTTTPAIAIATATTNDAVDTEQLSIVCSLARSWPKLERMHVGQQQGGFHLDSIRETLCEFPRLDSIGIPAWDCTKVTMDAIKAIQIHAMSNAASSSSSEPPSSYSLSSSWSGTMASAATSPAPARFLTSLCIMNVCSSEKVSQALHDYLCWTPHLKEFYAYNTTLYVDQMNILMDPNPVVTATTATATATSSSSIDPQGAIESSLPQVPLNENHGAERKRWACTGLERLVVRFARLPWRNLSEPPKRSKDTFGFLERLQNLKHLCIKEGLMLEAGREYEALAGLSRLEEVVFTTCYPIPIKVTDMKAWMPPIHGDAMVMAGKEKETGAEAMSRVLKKVVVRHQKANTVMDRELSEWFKGTWPDLVFGFELTDCCEEEYSFHHG